MTIVKVCASLRRMIRCYSDLQSTLVPALLSSVRTALPLLFHYPFYLCKYFLIKNKYILMFKLTSVFNFEYELEN